MKQDVKDPLIILIGGASGTGKTSIAKKLCEELGISHRLGSGFIREFAKSFVSESENPYLYNYSFRPHVEGITPFENLYKQSTVLKSGIELCIKRAFDEGTSIVIEGVNIIPGLISSQYTSLFAVLVSDDHDRHNQQIAGKTHSKRAILASDFMNVRSIQKEFVNAAGKNGCAVIKNTNIDTTYREIQQHLAHE